MRMKRKKPIFCPESSALAASRDVFGSHLTPRPTTPGTKHSPSRPRSPAGIILGMSDNRSSRNSLESWLDAVDPFRSASGVACWIVWSLAAFGAIAIAFGSWWYRDLIVGVLQKIMADLGFPP